MTNGLVSIAVTFGVFFILCFCAIIVYILSATIFYVMKKFRNR